MLGQHTKTNNVFWLAFVNDIAIGYAKLKINSPSPFLKGNKIGQLQKIYVLKDFLGQQVGQELQDELLSHAQTLGLNRIWLSVLKGNERAVGFYLKHGFEIMGDHTFQIGDQNFDFKAMVKALQLFNFPYFYLETPILELLLHALKNMNYELYQEFAMNSIFKNI